jgi:hypothetical protein
MVAISRIAPALFVVIAALSAAPAQAQIAATKPYASLFLVREAEVVNPPGRTQPSTLAAQAAPALPIVALPPAPVIDTTPRGLRPSLYAGLITLQALDTHSTFRAIDGGHSEQNPLMSWTLEHPAAFISMKAAATAATVLVAEKIRKRYPKRALVFMAAVNAAYAVIVVHNYRVPVR